MEVKPFYHLIRKNERPPGLCSPEALRFAASFLAFDICLRSIHKSKRCAAQQYSYHEIIDRSGCQNDRQHQHPSSLVRLRVLLPVPQSVRSVPRKSPGSCKGSQNPSLPFVCAVLNCCKKPKNFWNRTVPAPMVRVRMKVLRRQKRVGWLYERGHGYSLPLAATRVLLLPFRTDSEQA